MTSLFYIHIGKSLPEYIYDSVYQTLLMNRHATKLYVAIDDSVVASFQERLDSFNLETWSRNAFHYQSVVHVIPLSILTGHVERMATYQTYKNVISTKFNKELTNFRDGFWISTTARFFYIQAFMELFCHTGLFHIESDIMMYETFEKILPLCSDSCLSVVKDSPQRVVPSILLFPSAAIARQLNEHIVRTLVTSFTFVNDMNLLATFPSIYELPFCPNNGDCPVIFDGAAIGQYLGGVDVRNISDGRSNAWTNTTKGFVNETSLFKPDTCEFHKTKVHIPDCIVPLKVYACRAERQLYKVANLHIHSKQLYEFSGVFDVGYSDIITGDRVTSLCDFVIATHGIYSYHKNLDKYAKDVILVRDFEHVNTDLMNSFFRQHCKSRNTDTVRLFVYTHILPEFNRAILPRLDKSLKYIFYAHNSDHCFDDTFATMLEQSHVKHVYAQNIDIAHPKLSLLPIGIANSMWPHGDLDALYATMRETYLLKKTKSIYVNLNPGTFPLRTTVLDTIQKYNLLDVSSSKPYPEYLKELAEHRFCLCVRGNGIDTHRFWESLYLGVIPVVVNDKPCAFIDNLRSMGVPFCELEEISPKHSTEYFSESRYKRILTECETTFGNLACLKLGSYGR